MNLHKGNLFTQMHEVKRRKGAQALSENETTHLTISDLPRPVSRSSQNEEIDFDYLMTPHLTNIRLTTPQGRADAPEKVNLKLPSLSRRSITPDPTLRTQDAKEIITRTLSPYLLRNNSADLLKSKAFTTTSLEELRPHSTIINRPRAHSSVDIVHKSTMQIPDPLGMNLEDDYHSEPQTPSLDFDTFSTLDMIPTSFYAELFEHEMKKMPDTSTMSSFTAKENLKIHRMMKVLDTVAKKGNAPATAPKPRPKNNQFFITAVEDEIEKDLGKFKDTLNSKKDLSRDIHRLDSLKDDMFDIASLTTDSDASENDVHVIRKKHTGLVLKLTKRQQIIKKLEKRIKKASLRIALTGNHEPLRPTTPEKKVKQVPDKLNRNIKSVMLHSPEVKKKEIVEKAREHDLRISEVRQTKKKLDEDFAAQKENTLIQKEIRQQEREQERIEMIRKNHWMTIVCMVFIFDTTAALHSEVQYMIKKQKEEMATRITAIEKLKGIGFMKQHIIRWKKRKKIERAMIVRNFLLSIRTALKVPAAVRKFQRRVRTLQRAFRGWQKVRDARLELLGLIWDKVLRRMVADLDVQLAEEKRATNAQLSPQEKLLLRKKDSQVQISALSTSKAQAAFVRMQTLRMKKQEFLTIPKHIKQMSLKEMFEVMRKIYAERVHIHMQELQNSKKLFKRTDAFPRFKILVNDAQMEEAILKAAAFSRELQVQQLRMQQEMKMRRSSTSNPPGRAGLQFT